VTIGESDPEHRRSSNLRLDREEPLRAEIAVAEGVGVETLLHQGGAEAVRDLAKLRLQGER
jgi:hypothetical protein